MVSHGGYTWHCNCFPPRMLAVGELSFSASAASTLTQGVDPLGMQLGFWSSFSQMLM